MRRRTPPPSITVIVHSAAPSTAGAAASTWRRFGLLALTIIVLACIGAASIYGTSTGDFEPLRKLAMALPELLSISRQ